MGEAKRRKRRNRRKRFNPNDGKGKQDTRRVDAPLDWKRIQKPTTEELELAARQAVPAWLAVGFSQALDEGIEILPSARLPQDWPYLMHCVEFYVPAAVWVAREVFNDAKLSPEDELLALANACKVLVMASILAEQGRMKLRYGLNRSPGDFEGSEVQTTEESLAEYIGLLESPLKLSASQTSSSQTPALMLEK